MNVLATSQFTRSPPKHDPPLGRSQPTCWGSAVQLPDNSSSSKANIKPGWANDGLYGEDDLNTLPAVPFNFKGTAGVFQYVWIIFTIQIITAPSWCWWWWPITMTITWRPITISQAVWLHYFGDDGLLLCRHLLHHPWRPHNGRGALSSWNMTTALCCCIVRANSGFMLNLENRDLPCSFWQ